MNKGRISHLEAQYKEDKCIICLEKFDKKSNVHVTNEWSHVFHSKWLFKWYENIQSNKVLKCPHWNTPNVVRFNISDEIEPSDSISSLSMPPTVRRYVFNTSLHLIKTEDENVKSQGSMSEIE